MLIIIILWSISCLYNTNVKIIIIKRNVILYLNSLFCELSIVSVLFFLVIIHLIDIFFLLVFLVYVLIVNTKNYKIEKCWLLFCVVIKSIQIYVTQNQSIIDVLCSVPWLILKHVILNVNICFIEFETVQLYCRVLYKWDNVIYCITLLILSI